MMIWRTIINLVAAFVLIFFPQRVQGQSDSVRVNRRTLELSSAMQSVGGFVFDHSAAASYYRQNHSYTELWGQMDWRSEDEAFEPAVGDGLLQGAFHVTSYLRVDSCSAAFAGADYENGQKRNVCWNSTSDYAMLYPYVTVDSIGGDLQREQYRFYGGYARNNGRFSYGIEAAYRAQHEYRQVDPRPRNITADLSADLSAGYEWGTYFVGAAFGGRIYKQQQSVEFYDPNGANTSVLHFTGLGTFYQRYSGTTYTSVRFRGTGYHAAITLVPANHDGWYALADYEKLTVDRKLSGLNNATLTTLTLQTLTSGVAYRHIGKRLDWAVSATGIYVLRQGKEVVMGSGSSTDHMPLASQTLYGNHGVNARMEGVVSWKRPYGIWTLHPSAAFYWENEEYEYPHRNMEVSNLVAGATVDFSRLHKAWMWQAEFGGYYTANLDGTFNISFDDTDLRIYNYLGNIYSRRTDDWTSLHVRMRVQREVKWGTAVFVSAMYRKQFYGAHLQDDYLQLSAGLCF